MEKKYKNTNIKLHNTLQYVMLKEIKRGN
jgi:hypothetical protein